MGKLEAESSVAFALPPGEYWVGDPCYILSKEQYDAWLPQAKDGGDLVCMLDGVPIVTLETVYGDGVYPSNRGFEFGVDSGTLACIPTSITSQPDDMPSVFLLSVEEPFVCRRTETGTIQFGPVMIETGSDEADIAHLNGHAYASDEAPSPNLSRRIAVATALTNIILEDVREHFLGMIRGGLGEEHGDDEDELLTGLSSVLHMHAANIVGEDIATLKGYHAEVVAEHDEIDRLCQNGLIAIEAEIVCANRGYLGPAYDHTDGETATPPTEGEDK